MGRAWGRVLGGLELGVERGGRSGLGQWASVVLSAHKRLGVPRIKVHFWLMHKRCAASYNPNKMSEKTIHSETYEAAGGGGWGQNAFLFKRLLNIKRNTN